MSFSHQSIFNRKDKIMKFIAKFVRTEYKTAEVEIEAENEEAAMALINDEDNEDIWYKAAEKTRTEGVRGFPSASVGFVGIEEKSVHDERVKKEEEKRKWEEKNLPF